MRRRVSAASLVALVILAVAIWAPRVQAKAAKSRATTVRGEVVDLYCYLSQGARGAGHKACAVMCAQGGNPIGIVDSRGIVYVAMDAKMHESNRKELIQKMASTVTATGKVVDKGGVRAIYISSLK